MKSFSDDALAEIVAGTAIVAGAAEVLCDPPVRAWAGYEPRTIAGQSYTPVGDHGLAQVSGSALGGAEQNITLSLSGIDPALLPLLDASELRDAPTTLHRLIFKGDGRTMLDAQVFTRGRIDQVPVSNTIGGTATIAATVETAARGLGRQGGRMRTDADQRLIDPTDGYDKNVSYAGQKTLYWGGQRPSTASSALPNAAVANGLGLGLGGTGKFRLNAPIA